MEVLKVEWLHHLDTRILILLLEVLLAVTAQYARSPYENSVIGTPNIQCKDNSIELIVETEHNFFGRIFVKDQSDNQYCVRSMDPSSGSVGRMELPIGACGMRTESVLHPKPGIEYSVLLVVSFHDQFLTDNDRVFTVKCRYAQQTKALSSYFEVSIFPTQEIGDTFAVPDCHYTLHAGGFSGEAVEFAKIGEPIYHKWECDSDAYAIMVKNCYVDDGKRRKYQLLNKHGCANDPIILPDVTYNADLNRAYAKTHAFKFADRSHVFFRCQIFLCFKGSAACTQITPPNCDMPDRFDKPQPYDHLKLKYHHRRSVRQTDILTWENDTTDSETARQIELMSPRLLVLDIGEEEKLQKYVRRERLVSASSTQCMQTTPFLMLVITNVATLFVATFATLLHYRRLAHSK